MKKFLQSRDGASKGAALIIVLALVVLASALGLAYFSRTTTDRQLAQTSHNDTSADLLARSALDIVVGDFKQEIANNPNVTAANIQPLQYGVPPITDASPIPNMIRRSVSGDPTGRTSVVPSTSPSANGRAISRARWNSHYLIPRFNTGNNIDSTPISSFTPPDWVLLTAQGPKPAPAPNAVIGRYAFAVYDEGGLVDINVGGFPNYPIVGLPTLPGRPASPIRRMVPRDQSDESEIMLAAFTPNPPNPCNGQDKIPNFTPDHANPTLPTGAPCSILNTAKNNPDSYSVSSLPAGLSLNPANGLISGVPTIPRTYDVIVSATNQCGTGYLTLHLMVQGFPSPDSTPWPVNLARKGTLAFANLTTLPSMPQVITPTTLVSGMSGFLGPTSIDQLMGWRNYATTQQTGASFNSPSFASTTPAPDFYARYFLGERPPFNVPYTTVSTTVQNGRTDQAVMTRQELIKLQRTLCTDPVTGSYDDTKFPQNLFQYLGTFSRDRNRPAPDWPQLNGKLAGRFDMNNMQIVIPDSWLWPGHHGQGHGYGKNRRTDLATLFQLVWVPGTFTPGKRFTDPNYYGHWKYIGKLEDDNSNPLAGGNPDFFQIIDYAMNQAVGLPANSPNHLRNTFTVGAAIIDQYDTDDLFDAPQDDSTTGNLITLIDYLNDENHPENYAYGVETQSFVSPISLDGVYRPPFAAYPPPLPSTYARLNRRFENVGEFGYAYNTLSTLVSKTLDFGSATSNDRALLDFFTYNTAGSREGIVNLNTRNGPVLASIIRGAWIRDPGYEIPPPVPALPTTLVNQNNALDAAQAIVRETTNTALGHGLVLNRGDVARLAEKAVAAVPNLAGSDEAKQTIARALAEMGQARTWNLMIDVIAQTGNYTPGTPDLTDPSKFIVQGEKRYWLHIALDRDDGTVLGTQLEEVFE